MNYKEILIQLGLSLVTTITINFGIALSYMNMFHELPKTEFVLIIDSVLFSGVFMILRCFTFLPTEKASHYFSNVKGDK